MAAEVINNIHQLAIACNKYKEIVFTNKDGNIIHDENDTENKTHATHNIEITGVDQSNYSPKQDNEG